MGVIFAFPLSRRRDFIARQAEWFCDQGHRAAESNLHRQLMLQRDILLRRGIAPSVVEAQVKDLEGAIRAEALRITLTSSADA